VRAAAGIVLLAAAACAVPRGEDGAGADLAGCYQFRWDAAAAEMRLPWGFDLLDEPLEGWGNVPDGRVAHTRTTEGTTRNQPFAFWRRVAEDSIRVGHPGGGGLSLSLARQGPDLVGTAQTLGDAVPLGGGNPSPLVRPVVAYRVVCPT
jgi:hypothetical protein